MNGEKTDASFELVNNLIEWILVNKIMLVLVYDFILVWQWILVTMQCRHADSPSKIPMMEKRQSDLVLDTICWKL
jgi:hypothetical protein